MNNKTSTVFFLLISTPLLFGCGGPVKYEAKNTEPGAPIALHEGDEKYVAIDSRESVITWKGSNTFGAHAGYVTISKGELMMDDTQLVGGAVEVDMATIEDEEHRSDNGLIEHLKNPDFFDVKKFPISSIVITEVTSTNTGELTLTGNLTIKGITQPVSFPAKMEVKDGIVKASGKLVIDRTRWGIRYKSGKFYDFLADNSIADDIEFNMNIVAKKANF